MKGSIPEGLHVLINQNTAETIFNGDWKDQNLNLDIQLEQTVWTIPVTVTGMVEETDTGSEEHTCGISQTDPDASWWFPVRSLCKRSAAV